MKIGASVRKICQRCRLEKLIVTKDMMKALVQEIKKTLVQEINWFFYLGVVVVIIGYVLWKEIEEKVFGIPYHRGISISTFIFILICLNFQQTLKGLCKFLWEGFVLLFPYLFRAIWRGIWRVLKFRI